MAVFTNYIRAAVVLSVVFFVSSVAHGLVVDGQLDDWGVIGSGSQLGQGSAMYMDAGVLKNDVLNWGMLMPNLPEPSVVALMAMGIIGVPLRKRMK